MSNTGESTGNTTADGMMKSNPKVEIGRGVLIILAFVFVFVIGTLFGFSISLGVSKSNEIHVSELARLEMESLIAPTEEELNSGARLAKEVWKRFYIFAKKNEIINILSMDARSDFKKIFE